MLSTIFRDRASLGFKHIRGSRLVKKKALGRKMLNLRNLTPVSITGAHCMI